MCILSKKKSNTLIKVKTAMFIYCYVATFKYFISINPLAIHEMCEVVT